MNAAAEFEVTAFDAPAGWIRLLPLGEQQGEVQLPCADASRFVEVSRSLERNGFTWEWRDDKFIARRA